MYAEAISNDGYGYELVFEEIKPPKIKSIAVSSLFWAIYGFENVAEYSQMSGYFIRFKQLEMIELLKIQGFPIWSGLLSMIRYYENKLSILKNKKS